MKRWHGEVREIYESKAPDFLASTEAPNGIKTTRFIEYCIFSLGIPCKQSGLDVLEYKVNSDPNIYKIDTLQAPDFSEKERFLAWTINQLEQLQECLGVRTNIKEISSEVRGKRS